MRRRIVASAFLLVGLSAATPQRAVFVLEVSNGSDGKCAASMEGEGFLPFAKLTDFMRRLHQRHPHAEIRIKSREDTHWECVGGVMTTASRLGFRKIGFISQPQTGGQK